MQLNTVGIELDYVYVKDSNFPVIHGHSEVAIKTLTAGGNPGTQNIIHQSQIMYDKTEERHSNASSEENFNER